MKDISGKHNAYADGLSRLNENKKSGSTTMFQDALKVVNQRIITLIYMIHW